MENAIVMHVQLKTCVFSRYKCSSHWEGQKGHRNDITRIQEIHVAHEKLQS